jgi:hypothetical protein
MAKKLIVGSVEFTEEQTEIIDNIMLNYKPLHEYLLLVEIEDKLDKINGERGDKDGYCIYCGSKDYSGMVGIIHTDSCIMTEIRDRIKKLNIKY